MELVFLQIFQITSPCLSKYGNRIHKVDLTDHLGSPWSISKATYAACMENKNSNQQYTKREKNNNFLLKTFRHKQDPPTDVYYMELYFTYLEYSLIGIVKYKITRVKELWYRILEIEDMSKNVWKRQDRTFLSRNMYFFLYKIQKEINV